MGVRARTLDHDPRHGRELAFRGRTRARPTFADQIA